MFSTIQAICAVLLCIGVGGWWVACSLKREDLEKQIQQTLDAIDCACAYWGDKLADPAVSAYAQAYLVRLEIERDAALQMQTALAIGKRLTVKQLVRLDKLVSEHLAESSALLVLGLLPLTVADRAGATSTNSLPDPGAISYLPITENC